VITVTVRGAGADGVPIFRRATVANLTDFIQRKYAAG
jgi:hypothetical protein